MTDTIITSEAQFRAHLKELDFGEAGLLYRGQANAKWPVDCSAARRIIKDLANPPEPHLINSLLVGYLEFLIAKARMRDFLPPGFDATSPDLELLALLQHQGAATGLIDFTLQPSVALWFACNGSQEEDGAVYFLSRAATTEISDRDDIEKPLGSLYEKNILWSWKPAALGNRIVAQSSVFVFGVAEVGVPAKMGRLTVRAESKSSILSQLESLYGMNEEMLFPDFSGYAVANASTKFLDVNRTASYWQALVELATNDTERVEAHLNCGVAHSALKDFEAAIEQYDKAIACTPDQEKAYNNRGVAKAALDRRKEAIEDYDAAIRINPKYETAYKNRGNAKDRLGRREEAIEDYDAAIHINPAYVDAYKSRSLTNLKLRRYEDAAEDCNEAIAIDPRFSDAYHIRGDVKLRLGKFGEAIKDYDAAIRFNSENAKTYNNRGCVKAILGQHNEAIEDFKEAIRIDPKYMQPRKHLKQAQTFAQEQRETESIVSQRQRQDDTQS